MKNQLTSLLRILAIGLLATIVVACGDDDSNGEDPDENPSEAPSNELDPDEVIDPADHDIEIAGNWGTQFDTREDVDDDYWIFIYEDNDDLAAEIVSFDNEERWAITKNPDDADFSPGMYNRNVWTPLADGQFHYCTVDAGLESEEAAEQSEETADEADLDGGCGGFGWTEMTRL